MRKEIDKWGTIFYYNEKNKLHREEGPAMEFASGTREWYKNGNRHREEGPAREFAGGEKEYWYNNVKYPEIETDEEWKRFVKLIIFK